MTTALKPIYLGTNGIQAQLPDGGLINAGGTTNTSFTVGGVAVLLDTGNTGITLQSAYVGSPTVAGAAGIQLQAGKDFLITDATGGGDGNFFRINAANGTVTISGNLVVEGSSTIIDTIVTDADHWLLTPASASTVALTIQPQVTTTANLVNINLHTGASVFTISASGAGTFTQNLTVGSTIESLLPGSNNVVGGGLINGVDIIALANEVYEHQSGEAPYRHMAGDVDILPIVGLSGATNVQEALADLQTNINNVNTGGGNVKGFSQVVSVAALSWTVNHNGNTTNVQVTIYDTNFDQIIPQSVHIVDVNNIQVTFQAQQAGTAVLVLF
jgi:hypothetical protein